MDATRPIQPPHFATPEEIARTLDLECQRLEAENAKLRDALSDLIGACDGNYAELVAECRKLLT